jgi:hypothetical protein
VIPKKLAPKSQTSLTIFMASAVSTSSFAAGLPAEVQCTQLLSHSKVQRQGTMNNGPLLSNFISPSNLADIQNDCEDI